MFKSFLLVLLQFASIIYLAISGRIIPDSILHLIPEILFALLGIWAVVVMKLRFNIFPQPLNSSQLVNTGPYKMIRHPMYTSILLITLIWVIDDFSFVRSAVWLILLVILILKSDYEEDILSERFPDYENYKSYTKKFIPFIY